MDYSFLKPKKKFDYSFLSKKPSQEKQISQTTKGEIVTRTLSPDLGGGTYKMEVGNPNANIKTSREDYGGFPTKEGYERADIFPVSLSGVNASSTNIAYEKNLPEFDSGKDKTYRTATDKYLMTEILPKYKAGKISLREAQVLATSYLRNELAGLNKAMENENLGGKAGELADKIVGFFKGQKQEKKQPMVFKVGEGLNEEDKKIAEQIINYEVFKGEEEQAKKPLETQVYENITYPFTKSGRSEAKQRGVQSEFEYNAQAEALSKVLNKKVEPYQYKEEIKKVSPEEKNAVRALVSEKQTESLAKIGTFAPRMTVGQITRDYGMISDEMKNSNQIFTPEKDWQKLLWGDEEIRKLSESKDIYGELTRSAGIPVTIAAMVVADLDFGLTGVAKKLLLKKIAEEGFERVSKIGLNEYVKLLNKSIKEEAKLSKEVTPEIINIATKKVNTAEYTLDGGLTPQIKPQEATGEVLTPKVTKPLVPSKIAKIEAPIVKKPVVEAIRKKIAYNIEPDTKIKTLLKENKVGVEELPFDNKGNITLYREGPAIPGKLTSYSLGKKWEGQTPSIVNKNDIVINTNSPELNNLYNKTYKESDELSANLSALDKFKNLEGEIMVIQPKIETPPIKQTIKYIPEEKPVDLRKKITTKPLIAKSSVPNRIQDSAISKGLRETFGETFEHDIITFEDQAKKVGQILDEDPEKAIRIALGQEAPTNGALPESVLMAVVKQAEKKGDIELLRKLATEEKGVAQEASLLGARIKMYDQQLEDNAFKNIKDVVENRKKSFKGNLRETKNKEIAKIKEEIKKVKPKKDEWLEFISSITC